MFRLTVRFLFGCALEAIGFNTGWWLLVLFGLIPTLSTMTVFLNGLTAAIQAIQE